MALSPVLVSGVVAAQAREADILKQRRKAREERTLAGAGANKNKGQYEENSCCRRLRPSCLRRALLQTVARAEEQFNISP